MTFVAIVLLGAALMVGARYYWSGSGNLVSSVAVLPFVNTNGNPDEEYLCDGITEGLIHSLSQLPQLRVMSRSTVFRYKGKGADPQTVGRDLKVGAVLVSGPWSTTVTASICSRSWLMHAMALRFGHAIRSPDFRYFRRARGNCPRHFRETEIAA